MKPVGLPEYEPRTSCTPASHSVNHHCKSLILMTLILVPSAFALRCRALAYLFLLLTNVQRLMAEEAAALKSGQRICSMYIFEFHDRYLAPYQARHVALSRR